MNDIVIPEYSVSTDRLRIGIFIRLEYFTDSADAAPGEDGM